VVVVTAKTDDSKSAFLPAAGYRLISNGTLGRIGAYGYYWSSTYGGTYVSDAYYSSFSSNYVGVGASGNSEATGFSVRCVSEVMVTP
jgi:uncharacterized protein (TIGR02145 family)